MKPQLNWQCVLRWLVGLVLIWASLSKLVSLQEFYDTLLAYRLPAPAWLMKIMELVLPWFELLCGFMLLVRIWTEAALVCAIVLFAIFAVATGQAWFRGLEISCGCLDLSLIGLPKGSAPARLLESAGFACIRAIMLFAAACYLFIARPPSHAPNYHDNPHRLIKLD